MSIADLRKEYTCDGLSETDVDVNPFVQFQTWFDAAVAAQLPEPNAMTLATVNGMGQPSARIVLLKGFDVRGFVFYTSYQSRKGSNLADNPAAALIFYWAELERQVRIEGVAYPIAAEESDAYFTSRPHESQLGAVASHQSSVIQSRVELEERLQALTEEYRTRPIPRPPHWGGYRVVPHLIEFWQGRPSRLHDRLCYLRGEDGVWVIERLSP
ncbi:MAG: pyridoxamine 5*-phosphate oxidase [Chloroflexi bacterium AL-W]|nr:pyridoxamine 5*-phosphate oxidase [Chloroflexi bacterium AL-N1]NOK69138.1 pyridoxamine 5*-phosphate oxidase [Chloroflexi bacterium AL-N10]NOK77121.1 pyridoxamine 5*-phosphate oxidase [Chloroflexi bacterium AL-N5]NOK83766.1 pyridoxamine 5*-phosphate oxidase [Chloroflexi bacterium AL-W]NOK90976.1 pyridoxamine 5*-phosphate oxidase [Chloroflexi bacterium AL-N15]